jgi:hypothetical protein
VAGTPPAQHRGTIQHPKDRFGTGAASLYRIYDLKLFAIHRKQLYSLISCPILLLYDSGVISRGALFEDKIKNTMKLFNRIFTIVSLLVLSALVLGALLKCTEKLSPI